MTEWVNDEWVNVLESKYVPGQKQNNENIIQNI